VLKRILVVDDSTSIREFLVLLLTEQTGAEITCCSDGREAMDIIQAGYTPDLALFDLNMPRLDGVQLLRELSIHKFQSPIVIISGLSRQIIGAIEKLSQEYQLNVIGTIGKPIDQTAIAEVLERLEDEAQLVDTTDEIKTYEVLEALKEGKVEPWFQPQVELQKRKLVGFEVLCRIRHHRHGLMTPGTFMNTLERSDLIRVVTLELFELALTKIHGLPVNQQDFNVSFNISAKLFDSESFIDELIELINKSPVSNERITIEITESTLASIPIKELEGTARLAINGCSLSIDDFGSGKATFDRLHALPFSELKIDQQYMPRKKITEAQRALLESTIAMARRLGMKVVVEGVETFYQWELVQHLGCEMAQGYFIAPPMPFEQIEGWIGQWVGKT